MLLFQYDWLLIVLRISRVDGHFRVTGWRGRYRSGAKDGSGEHKMRYEVTGT